MTHVEDEYIIEIGRKKLDVSNVAVKKSLRALDLYNENVVKLQNEEITAQDFNRALDVIGLELVKHDYDALRIRFNPFRSVIEIIKRSLIKDKHIIAMSKENYEEWQSWVYFAITGDKKKDLETTADLMETTTKMYQRMQEELNLNPEQCSELLMTLLKDQVKELQTSTNDHKIS